MIAFLIGVLASACAGNPPRPPVPTPAPPGFDTTIAGVTFEGTRAIASELLAAHLGPRFVGQPLVDGTLERATLELENYYYDRGYARVQIRAHAQPGSNTLVFEVEEGDLFRLGVIAIRGDVPSSDHPKYLALLGVKTGEVFDRSAIAAGRERVTDAVVTTGRPNAIVLPMTELDSQAHTIALTLEISDGEPWP